MHDAHPDYIASLAEFDRARLRQRRVFLVLACIVPAAGLAAVVVSLLR